MVDGRVILKLVATYDKSHKGSKVKIRRIRKYMRVTSYPRSREKHGKKG